MYHSGSGQKTLISGHAGEEKNLHPGGRKFVIWAIFRRYSIFFFSFLSFLYSFFVFVFFLLICFLKLKMYILIHIRLCGRVSDKSLPPPRPISRNKTTFFGLVISIYNFNILNRCLLKPVLTWSFLNWFIGDFYLTTVFTVRTNTGRCIYL